MAEPSPALFDETLVLHRRIRALRAGGGRHFLMQLACDDLALRLAAVSRPFAEGVMLHCGRDAESALNAARPGISLKAIDADAAFNADEIAPAAHFAAAGSRFDLAVSLLAMHAVNDLPGYLIQARRVLRPDGLFIGCMLGAGTLQELRDVLLQAESELSGGVSPRVAPFADVRDAGGLLQRAGFALPVTDAETLTVRHDSLCALLADLRAMGMGNALAARSRRPLSRAFWARAAALYAERFADPDGRIRATFTLVWMSGWAPDESQPKALRPGSAKVSLRDVL